MDLDLGKVGDVEINHEEDNDDMVYLYLKVLVIDNESRKKKKIKYQSDSVAKSDLISRKESFIKIKFKLIDPQPTWRTGCFRRTL